MATNILLKRGISSSFTSAVLKAGEPAFLIDNGKFYIGDGIKKVLINPIDKPISINTTNYFTKTKVNEYGQVVAQTNLAASDIPAIPNTRVTGLGSAAVANTGVESGNIPILDTTARLSETVMPLSVIGSGALAHYNGISGTLVYPNQYIPLSGIMSTSNIYSIDINGIVSINQAGIYLVTYNVSSPTLQLHTSLGPGNTNNWIGSQVRSTTTAVIPYTCTSATIMRQITTVPEKYGIKNLGPTEISLMPGYASLSIIKIG